MPEMGTEWSTIKTRIRVVQQGAKVRGLASDYLDLPPSVCTRRQQGVWYAPCQARAVQVDLVAFPTRRHFLAIARIGVDGGSSSAGYSWPRPTSASAVRLVMPMVSDSIA